MCVCVCVYVCVCVCLSVGISVSVSVCVPGMSVSLSVCYSENLSVYLSGWQSGGLHTITHTYGFRSHNVYTRLCIPHVRTPPTSSMPAEVSGSSLK